MRSGGRRIAVMLAVVAAMLLFAHQGTVFGQQNSDCMACHSDTTLRATVGG